MKRIIAAILLLLLLSLAINAAFGREFTDRTFISSHGQVLPYRILFPENYSPSRQYPLLLFLHGAGERGTDNRSQTAHGQQLLLSDKMLEQAIVIVPQCPKEDYWVNIVRPVTSNAERTFPEAAPISASLMSVKELVDSFIILGIADKDRIYGTGLSMGAFGILDLAMRNPDYFAAVELICGGVNLNRISSYKGKTAFRFFHGLKDDIVPPHFSQEAHKVLKENGIESCLVEYPQANHNSWDTAFSEPDYIEWLFKHSKRKEP
ncbi:MAG: phospholipase [Bacteroidales bacterium]|nr:phospholipase [Bacteroidales bacterium]